MSLIIILSIVNTNNELSNTLLVIIIIITIMCVDYQIHAIDNHIIMWAGPTFPD